MRIERLTVKNYRVLREVTFKDLTPLTVLCGPIDAIRSKGETGPVSFEIAYRSQGFEGRDRLVTYTLAVDQEASLPVVKSERLRWSTAPGAGRPRDILTFEHGAGTVFDEVAQEYDSETLASPDLLAVSALGQFQAHPRVKALRDFIQGWYLSYVSADGTRTTPNAGPERRLTQSGDNLANVIQYLDESHPERLRLIFETLSRRRVPQLENVLPLRLDDGRLLLRLKDRPFEEPVLARFASDGTLKLLAYLTVLNDPEPFEVIGIEEPENQLHPRLLPILTEEIREVSGRAQVLVTTHSPEFLTAVRADELWTIGRSEDGFARVARASKDAKVTAMMDAGATLGSLWSEGYLPGADPAGV